MLPEVPAVAETVPGDSAGPWYGVLAPGATRQSIVAKRNQEVVRILLSPEVKQNLAADGADPIGSTPAQFASHLKAETERWGKVVRQARMKVD